MRYVEIAEVRRNPEQNPKTSINAILQDYLNQAEQFPGAPISNLFVSFTNLPKLGINPRSEYTTPNGIYAYPVNFVMSKTKLSRSMNVLPFAGSSPWANIFRVNPDANIIVLQNVSKAMLESYIALIKQNLLPKLGIEDNRFGFGIMLSDVEAQALTPGEVLWRITGELGSSMSENAPVGWNAVCRSLGIDGFIDLGSGIIHPAERTQAVFFKSTDDVIQMIDRVANKYSPDRVKARQDAGGNYKGIAQNTRRLVRNIVAGNSEKTAVQKISELAPLDIKYLAYSPKNIRLAILKDKPQLLLRLAMSRKNYVVDSDEVLAAINNQQKRYEEFQQTKLANFLHPNERERLKNMGYNFALSYEGVKL